MWLDTQMALPWTRNDLWHTPECVGWLQALGHITLLLFLSFKESFLQHWLRCQTQSEPKIHLTVRHSSCFLWPAVVQCQPKNYLSKKRPPVYCPVATVDLYFSVTKKMLPKQNVLFIVVHFLQKSKCSGRTCPLSSRYSSCRSRYF